MVFQSAMRFLSLVGHSVIYGDPETSCDCLIPEPDPLSWEDHWRRVLSGYLLTAGLPRPIATAAPDLLEYWRGTFPSMVEGIALALGVDLK